jgi:hypothetical protein
MTKENIELTFNLLDALGSVATFLAFLMLFKKNKEQEAQIASLAKLANNEEKRLRLMMLPDLRIDSAGINPNEHRITIDIINFGEYALLTEFRLNSTYVSLDQQNLHLPFKLDKEAQRKIFLLGNANVALNQAEYAVEVIYQNRMGDPYKLKITGTGAVCSISEVKQL